MPLTTPFAPLGDAERDAARDECFDECCEERWLGGVGMRLGSLLDGR